MIIAKNPQGKTEANCIKNMMLKHAYVDEKKVQLRSFHYNDCREVTANVCVYKTDKGEYMHPIDMNKELARRFELLERFSSIDDGSSKPNDTRALSLQFLYAELKATPKAEVKKRMLHLKRSLAKQEEYMGGKKCTDVREYDELYVIENLLNIR